MVNYLQIALFGEFSKNIFSGDYEGLDTENNKGKVRQIFEPLSDGTESILLANIILDEIMSLTTVGWG